MFRLLCTVVLFLFAPALMPAQMITASLDGLITDPSGAVVAGARVHITNADTG